MKKTIISIVVLLTFILNIANANDNIEDKNLNTLKKEAIEVYKAKDYEKAYELLSKIYMSVLGDSKINFLLGRSAYETRKYEIALASFERVQILDPNNTRNDLELGRTQFKLEMYEDARINFKKVLKNPNLPETVRKNIELFLTKVEDQLDKSFFNIKARAGIIYDTNVNYGPYSNTSSTIPSEDGSFAHEFQANLTHIYDIGDKNGLELRNQASIYNRQYTESDLEDYNIFHISYSPALIYEKLKTIYELNLIIDRMFVDGTDYMGSISLMPAFIHKLDASNRLMGSLKLMDKSFKINGNNTKDARNYEITLAYQKLLSDSYYTFKTFISTENKKRGNRVDVSYDSFGLYGNYVTQIYPTYIAKVESSFKTKKYDDFSTFFNNKRKDDIYNLGFNISKKFTSDIYLDGKVDYERAFSNQNVYSYDKASYGLYLNITF